MQYCEYHMFRRKFWYFFLYGAVYRWSYNNKPFLAGSTDNPRVIDCAPIKAVVCVAK